MQLGKNIVFFVFRSVDDWQSTIVLFFPENERPCQA